MRDILEKRTRKAGKIRGFNWNSKKHFIVGALTLVAGGFNSFFWYFVGCKVLQEG